MSVQPADGIAQRMLLQQLTTQLAQSALPDRDEGGSTGAATDQVRSLFAQTLADAVAGPLAPAAADAAAPATSPARRAGGSAAA